MAALRNWKTKPKLWASAALLATGLASGAILGVTMSAGASSTTSTSAATAPGAPGGGSSSGSGDGTSSSGNGSSSAPAPPAYHGLPKSGTVTAVGSNNVTIDGTTYAVTSSSDIDKNGESTLAALAVGDTVTFSTDSSASTPTIDKLHAGNESLDRPSGGPNPGSRSWTTPPSGGAPA